MTRNTLFLGGLTSILALGLIACGNADETPNDPGTTTPAHADLFACSVELTCAAYCIHLSYGDCGGPPTLACPGDLWAQGTPGALEVNDRPGPGNWMGDTRTFLLGDGTALVQQRTRQCPNGDFCDLTSLPWTLGAHQLCDVKTPPTTCQPGNCSDFPLVENCKPLEKDWSCEAVTAALE